MGRKKEQLNRQLQKRHESRFFFMKLTYYQKRTLATCRLYIIRTSKSYLFSAIKFLIYYFFKIVDIARF